MSSVKSSSEGGIREGEQVPLDLELKTNSLTLMCLYHLMENSCQQLPVVSMLLVLSLRFRNLITFLSSVLLLQLSISLRTFIIIPYLLTYSMEQSPS